MKRFLLFSVLIFTLIFVSGCESWYSELSPSGKIAANFIQKIEQKDFQSAYELFSENMKSRYNVYYSLEMEWQIYESIFGQHLSIKKPKSLILEEDKEIHKFPIVFEKGEFILEITVQNNLICELKTLGKKLPSSFDSILYPKIDLRQNNPILFERH